MHRRDVFLVIISALWLSAIVSLVVIVRPLFGHPAQTVHQPSHMECYENMHHRSGSHPGLLVSPRTTQHADLPEHLDPSGEQGVGSVGNSPAITLEVP